MAADAFSTIEEVGKAARFLGTYGLDDGRLVLRAIKNFPGPEMRFGWDQRSVMKVGTLKRTVSS